MRKENKGGFDTDRHREEKATCTSDRYQSDAATNQGRPSVAGNFQKLEDREGNRLSFSLQKESHLQTPRFQTHSPQQHEIHKSPVLS